MLVFQNIVMTCLMRGRRKGCCTRLCLFNISPLADHDPTHPIAAAFLSLTCLVFLTANHCSIYKLQKKISEWAKK